MEAIWSKNASLPERTALLKDKQVHTVVIGGGMAGILTAYFLKKRGVDVIVVEADRIAGGQTGRTTAKITSQHGLKYYNLAAKIGRKKAELYARANEEAIQAYELVIGKEKISCAFERQPSYLYTQDVRKLALLQEEAKAAAELGIKASYMDKAALDSEKENFPFLMAGAVCFKEQAQFDPLQFIGALSEQLTVYENTKVLSVKKNTVCTSKGDIQAEHIVFATHYPFVIVPGFYFLRQHQERSYAMAFSDAWTGKGMYYSIDEGGLSLRCYDGLLLAGACSHRTGKNEDGGNYEKLEQRVRAATDKKSDTEGKASEANKTAENDRKEAVLKEEARWSAQDCMPHDGIPFIGRFSVFRSNWYVATGFQKWGMTSSMLAGMVISDLICGRENEYEELFSPQRFLPVAAAGNFIKDLGASVQGLVKGAFHLPFQRLLVKSDSALPRGSGKIVRIGWKRYAVYKDEKGQLYSMSARCPHMGCELTFNPDEKTWDCPCHGSRFRYDGILLDSPSKRDMQEKTLV